MEDNKADIAAAYYFLNGRTGEISILTSKLVPRAVRLNILKELIRSRSEKMTDEAIDKLAEKTVDELLKLKP